MTSRNNLLLSVLFFVVSVNKLCVAISTELTGAAAVCDESKCRTTNPNDTPRYWWMPLPPANFQGGYTCWVPTISSSSVAGEEQHAPNFACAEGYTGKPVANVTQQDENNNIIYQWYTCCTDESTISITNEANKDVNAEDVIASKKAAAIGGATDAEYMQDQICSDAYCDPITTPDCWAVPHGLAPRRCVDEENEGENKFRFPRNTGAILEVDNGAQQYTLHQFLCCKEPPLNPTEEAEVESNIIGFNSELDSDGDWIPDGCSLDACTSLNGAKGGPGDCWADGVTEPFTCDTKDPNNPFIYPTRNGFDDLNVFNFHYLCCDSPDYFDNGQEGDDLHIALAIQSTISFITAIISFVFFTAILCNKKARSQSWNIYLVMLSIPDAAYNFFRFGYGVAVIMRSNTFVTTTWFVDWFYAVANLLLNVVVVYEVHKFLRAYKQMVRIPPPSRQVVLVQSFFVYAIALGCGSWMYTLHTIGNTITGSHPQFLKAHKISLFCMVIPPIFVVIAICVDVWNSQLLPSANGRTRMLALYFLRVIFVFLVTWLPYMILITFGLRDSRILTYIGMCISSVQGTLSVIVALSKSDIEWAVRSFLTGKCNEEPPRDYFSKKAKGGSGTIRVSGLFSPGVDIGKLSSEVLPQTSGVCSGDFEASIRKESPLIGNDDDVEGIGSSDIKNAGSHNDSETSESEEDVVRDNVNAIRAKGSARGSIDASFRVDMTGAVVTRSSDSLDDSSSHSDDDDQN